MATSRQIVRFGPFEVDAETGEVRKDGTRIKLQDQPFKVLCLLLERPGELVKREDLKLALMPDASFGDFDHAINVAVAKLRVALADSSETPRYIETLPRRGYRFIGELPKWDHGTTGEPNSSISAPVATASLSAPAAQIARHHQWRYVIPAAVILLLASALLVVRGTGLWGRWFPPSIRSVVVLPLVNLSGDAQQEYFADGMTDAIISELARVRGLRVVSRTSAMQFKGTRESLPAIARRLNVDGVIEASFTRSGDRVRVRAQLVHAATDTPVWVGAYDRDLRDLLAMQTELAQSVAQAIRLEITPAEAARRAHTRAVEPQAQQHYLLAFFYYQRLAYGPEGRAKSIAELQKALAVDPNYAPAYALLAANYAASQRYAEDMPKAKAAALKAVELDDSLAAAHLALMRVLLFHEWDWAGAEREARRALQLEPGSAAVHAVVVDLLWMNRVDEALAQAKTAYELDPLAIGAALKLGRAYHFARRYDEAVEQFRKAIELDKGEFAPHFFLAITLLHMGRTDEAIASFITANRLGDDSKHADEVERIFRQSGSRAALYELTRRFEERAAQGRAQAISVALMYVKLGDTQKAFDWLERAYAQRSPSLLYLQTDPQWDPLRSDPRYEALVRKIGLPSLAADASR